MLTKLTETSNIKTFIKVKVENAVTYADSTVLIDKSHNEILIKIIILPTGGKNEKNRITSKSR